MDLRTSEGRKALGKRIQSAVAEAGHGSLTQFATELGCSRALIYQYVNGNVLVQLDRLQAVSELTGKPLGWFFAQDAGAAAAQAAEVERRLSECEARREELQGALALERGARLQESEQHSASRVGLLRELCLAHQRAGDSGGVLEVGPRWLALAQEAGNERACMDARLQMGHAWFQSGQLDQAKAALGQALEAARRLGEARAEQSIRQELVRCLQVCGRIDEARAHALELAALDAWWPRWSARLTLAALAEQTGDLDEAERLLGEAEAVIDEPDAPDERRPVAQAYLGSNRVNTEVARGRYSLALRLNEGFRLLAEQAGLPDQMREAALNEAICLIRTHHSERAEAILLRLREWSDGAGDQRMSALAAVFLSERARDYGDLSEAKRLARAAMEAAGEASSGHALAEAELALGEVYLEEGSPEDARYYLDRCASRAERLQLHKLRLTAQLALAQAALLEGDGDACEKLTSVATEAADTGYEDLHAAAVEIMSAGDDTGEVKQ